MSEVQPTWMGPLTHGDARLTQAIRLGVSRSSVVGGEPFVYGNNKGMTLIFDRRVLVEFDPPSYFRNHSSAMKDGFGNAAMNVKARIASGNAEHGNYAVSGFLYHAFAPRIGQNGMLTSFYEPGIVAGRGFGRFALLGTLAGVLPTGKIQQQGRVVETNLTGQAHLSAHTWFDVENNSQFIHGGAADGKMQNEITPALFYVIRRKSWSPAHAYYVIDAGEQIATSTYYASNHNVIAELRIAF